MTSMLVEKATLMGKAAGCVPQLRRQIAIAMAAKDPERQLQLVIGALDIAVEAIDLLTQRLMLENEEPS